MATRMRPALLAALLLLTACADTGGRPIATSREEPGPPPPASSVRATNHNWSLVIVYVLLDGRSVRLGQVETGRTLTFTLPASVQTATEVELLADPFTSNLEYRTGPLLIEPGAQIELVVENDLALSHASLESI